MSYLELAKKLRTELGTDATIRDEAERPEIADAFAAADSVLVSSRVLGESVWLAPDDATAERLEGELAAEGDTRLVFTLAEAQALRGMLAADMRTLVNIKRRLSGSRIDHVARREGNADA